MNKKQTHKPVQRKDGSIYTYCDEFPNHKIGCSVNHLTKKIYCSVCGKILTTEVQQE